MGIIISHYKDDFIYQQNHVLVMFRISYWTLDQGFVVILNVDPTAMTSVTLVPHRDKKM